ncbi:MAG: BamA/TamA family outer membrane protein [Phycisphaerae bacterium]|jgi:outer membrane protein insertion porin family
MLNSKCPGRTYRRTGSFFFIFILLFVLNNAVQAESNNIAQAGDSNLAQTEPSNVEPAEPGDAAALENKVIDSVLIQGNIYIGSEKILSAIRSRQGQQFTAAEAQEDIKRIAAINGVEFAYYSLEPVGQNVKIIFVVKEKRVIRQITFSGDRKIGSDKLIEKLGFSRGDYIDNLTAKAGAEKLTEYYKKTGYPFVKVDFDDSGIEQGRLNYIIEQGTKVKIKKVKFEGNASMKKKELLKAIRSKPRQLGFIQNYFKQDVVDDDLIKLQQAYDKRGYLDTKVTARTDFRKDKKGVDIVYAIDEGRQYDVAKIEFTGNKFLSDANLAGNFRLKEGKFYSNEKSDLDRDEILRLYREQGFIDVQVQSGRQFTADNKIIAKFDVKEGERFRIGQINISGNKTVQDKVIRRVLDEDDFKPGEWYNAHIAQGTGEGQLEKDIKAGVYTETATITPVGEKPGQKDAEVRITEGKTGSILFGAGISSTDGLIGQMVYEQRNFDVKKWPKNWRKFFSENAFKGAGQRLRIAAEPGTEVSRYSISFTEPYLKDKPISMTVAGSNWERGRESYNEMRQKGYLGFTRRMKKGWYRTLAFRLENVGIEDIDGDAPKEVRDVKGDNFLAGIRIGFGRNSTDSQFNPTTGRNYELSYEQVGGDHTFGILDGTYRWYKTLREDLARRKTVLETKFYAATIVGDAPLFEKFYAGGSGSVRGFEYRGISPRSGADKDPVGSRWIATASGEVTVPLTTEALSALFFVDTGMVDTGGIRVAAGIGIQILLPQWFGPVPMRFELATPFIKSEDDDTQMFSFSVGTLF